jgi:hypothetical protein
MRCPDGSGGYGWEIDRPRSLEPWWCAETYPVKPSYQSGPKPDGTLWVGLFKEGGLGLNSCATVF